VSSITQDPKTASCKNDGGAVFSAETQLEGEMSVSACVCSIKAHIQQNLEAPKIPD
jgi:hypothetical protein